MINAQGIETSLSSQLTKLNLEEMIKGGKSDDKNSWAQRLQQNYKPTYPRLSKPANLATLQQVLSYPFNATAVLLYPASSDVRIPFCCTVDRPMVLLCLCTCGRAFRASEWCGDECHLVPTLGSKHDTIWEPCYLV